MWGHIANLAGGARAPSSGSPKVGVDIHAIGARSISWLFVVPLVDLLLGLNSSKVVSTSR